MQTPFFDEQVMGRLYELYSRYTNEFKPLLATVEAVKNRFPGPILNEIRAFNDHISRCYASDLPSGTALNEIRKAEGHLERAILDCFKSLLIIAEDKVCSFYTQYKDVNLAVVNDGKFLPRLNELHTNARNAAINAKKIESASFPEKERAYTEYKKAILMYKEIDDFIDEKTEALKNAIMIAKKNERKALKMNWFFAIFSAILGCVLGCFATLLIEWIKDL